MPVNPTYPGVYIEEIPSGVHTITGVATSITAFIGVADTGPINQAVHIYNFGDYQRAFGGLSANSWMSYAVMQYFLNGGTEAWVVRLGNVSDGAGSKLVTASVDIADDTGTNVLTVKALNAGLAGNSIQVLIDDDTPLNPGNFNITFTVPAGPGQANQSETYQNLSLVPTDSRYALNLINGVSQLVTVSQYTPPAAAKPAAARPATAAQPGNLTSGSFSSNKNDLDVRNLFDQLKAAATGGPAANTGVLNIQLDHQPATEVPVDLSPLILDGAGNPIDSSTFKAGNLNNILKIVSGCIKNAATRFLNTVSPPVLPLLTDADAYNKFNCVNKNQQLVLTSGTAGVKSSVEVVPAANAAADIGPILQLTSAKGGTTIAGTDAIPAAALAVVPAGSSSVLVPTSGYLISGQIQSASLPTVPDGTHNTFMLQLDGDSSPTPIVVDSTTQAQGNSDGERLQDIAKRIQKAVRTKNRGSVAYQGFTCTADTTNLRLILASGTQVIGSSKTSSIQVTKGTTNDLATALQLTGPGITPVGGSSRTLKNGSEVPFSPTDPNSPKDWYTDPNASLAFQGDQVQRTGIFALEGVDLFNLLCIPGVTPDTDSGKAILTAALSYCMSRRAVLIVDPPRGKQPEDMYQDFVDASPLPKSVTGPGTYAALYYPWVRLPDILIGSTLASFPPCGIIAGLYARTDATRGVWKAPAGIDASLIGVQKLDFAMTDAQNGRLNPHGINCLRTFPVYGTVCWGARTLSGDDQLASDYKYVPVRRLALFIEESLYRGTKWVVFEPNDEPLWAQIRLNVGAFMHNLFRQGAFQGQTPRDAYLVKCDSETTTQNDIDLGIVNILVAFAPLKPAEFVVIQIQQIAGQIEV